VIDKDATLRRMLPGQPDLPAMNAPEQSKAPILAALAIYALALVGGTFLGMQGEANQAEALDAVDSQWSVESGTLEITVKQLGSDVTGRFEDWTAEISFDPETETGAVKTVVSIGSLTLGSVTKDALGPDYLNANESPTATFEADISRTQNGLVADGTLDLLGQIRPLQLPFTLDLTDGIATVQGQTLLNRMDYGVGATAQPTEGSLGFDVVIKIDLTARAPE
jgi:polyisoprenoid-binding protein YceI